MLKHTVEVNAKNAHEVVVRYTITDGSKRACSETHIHVRATPDAYEIVPNTYTFYGFGNVQTNYVVRIINLEFHNEAVVRQLKRECMEHFHKEVRTEYRMNEG